MKQMIKRILSGCLALMMVVGYVPVQALDMEYVQSISLPIIEEGEEAPAPQGLGISTFAMVANDASYKYMYEGESISNRYFGNFAILDTEGNRITKVGDSGDWNVDVPTNGTFQLRDSEGNIIAASKPAEDYYQEYLEDDATGTSVYYLEANSVQFVDIMDGYTSYLSPGEYFVYLVAGEIAYPTELKFMVVPDDCLMLSSLYTEGLNPGVEYFDVRMYLYGFRYESELADISMEMTDAEGNVVAQSTGRFRDINNQSYWGNQEWVA